MDDTQFSMVYLLCKNQYINEMSDTIIRNSTKI